MKILVVGHGASNLHENAVADAFHILGHQVHRFFWQPYFQGKNSLELFFSKIQNKYLFGPKISALNKDLLEKTSESQPDIIFIYRGTHILASTLEQLRKTLPKAIIIAYNNDDPFSDGHSLGLWRQFLKGLKQYHLVLAYRHHNLDDFIRHGAKKVELLRSWYLPHYHYPIVLSEKEIAHDQCDLVFIGHFENDGRLDYFDALADAGIRFRIYGPEWHKAPLRPWLTKMGKILPVRGEDYTRVLCSSKIALCFLSRLNRDTYTRRVFEIPATATMMLSEYTDDLSTLFIEDKEAVFFRSPSELVAKVERYLADDQLRMNIAQAGYKKVSESGHDVISRMKQVLTWSEQIQGD